MIYRQEEKRSDEDIYRLLNPLVAEWFRKKFGSFTEPQKYAIPNIHARKNTLVSEDFPILKETRREIMEDAMDLENARKVVSMLKSKKIHIKEIETQTPSPFAFGLFVQGVSEIMKMEERLAFVKRLHEQVLAKIKSKKGFEDE